jgi:hypothetical protein
MTKMVDEQMAIGMHTCVLMQSNTAGHIQRILPSCVAWLKCVLVLPVILQ